MWIMQWDGERNILQCTHLNQTRVTKERTHQQLDEHYAIFEILVDVFDAFQTQFQVRVAPTGEDLLLQ